MQVVKTLFLGALLAAVAPLAVADTITITGAESASGITSTGVSFGNKVTAAGAHLNQSTATLTGDTGYFATQFTTSASAWFLPTITTGGTTAPSFKFTSINSGAPLHLLEIIQGGNTLELYLTTLTGSTAAGTGVTGFFTATGYITDTGLTGNIPVTFSFTNQTAGSSARPFTAVITTANIASAPEPSSLVLLGSGVLSAAGMVFRKRRTV